MKHTGQKVVVGFFGVFFFTFNAFSLANELSGGILGC